MKKGKRNGVIDFLRFIFCTIIVICHSRNLGGTEFVANKALFADAGYIGVEFFFLVSGFLMAKSALSMPDSERTLGEETLSFLWRKISVILPYYLFAVFFSYSRVIFVNAYSLKETVRNFLMGIWDLFFLRTAGFKSVTLLRANWYMSAMFVAMFILFPMIRRWKQTFTHIIAPLLSIFLLGYLMQTYANLNLYINKWKLFYPGLLRGIAEISLGCVCYEICEKMKGVSYTSFSRFLITVAQLLGYGFVIYCMHDLPGGKQFEFVFVPILAFCVTLSFSGQGIATGLFTSKVFTWLGKMSMIIYLNHMWVKDSINVFLPKSLGYWKLLVICLFCVFVASLICMFIMDGIMRWLNRHRSRIYRCFIKV